MHLSGDSLVHYESLPRLGETGPVKHIGVHLEIITAFKSLLNYAESLPAAFTGYGSTKWFSVQALASVILGRIADLPDAIRPSTRADMAIERAISFMNGALGQPFDLEFFAKISGYGGRHFTRQFIRVTGLAPNDWFIRQRMETAKILLTNPSLQIKDIGMQLGYTSPSYFSKTFKRINGGMPQDYRGSLARETAESPQ